MILVDASVWISYFNGKIAWQTELLDQLLQTVPLLIGDLILTEVLQGFRFDRDFEKAKSHLDVLPCRTIGGYDLALQSAINYRRLRKQGITIRKTVDVLIGTFCIQENLLLLHDDRDFDPMVAHLGLKIISSDFLFSTRL
ncbi:MAG: PIN domain nuclease [SAR324 cluster bacterium]|nr:PIN domain nuclease [SAR324 cluster bacterium]